MSHFSKIKTNISNLSVLKQTLKDLGFHLFLSSSSNLYKESEYLDNSINLVVYNCSLYKDPLFSFLWNGFEYNLIVDLQLWSLDIDVNYFIDKLSQKYAYNLILNKSISSGFQKVSEKITADGSMKITVQKWFS
uniref:Uncharacterized protein ycf35 n=1 Tax=Bostrychia simpliciuscula TaxID=324754 RepID=A0A1Z1M7E3_9FLOR|nr:hypothetical protein [Bostrychia simpliciuscula]ARW62008.1 hypothetical protein [Bostrychia simpliciuscula]